MSRFADLFKGKLLLLVLDKVVIGAIVGGAFIIYDRTTTEETRNYEEKRLETQLQFERARLLKEFLPAIQDPQTSPITRRYLLRSAILTKSLDADTAFSIGRDFLYGKIPEDRYKEFVSYTLPGSIGAFARRGVEIAREWHSALGGFPRLDAKFNPLNDVEHFPEGTSSFIKEARLLRDLLYGNLPAFEDFQSSELSKEDKIRDSLFGLFVLLQTSDSQNARRLSRIRDDILRLLGMIIRLWQSNGNDLEAQNHLEMQFLNANRSSEQLKRAMVLVALLRWISDREDGLASSAFARVLGKVAVGELPKDDADVVEEDSIYWLRWDAAGALYQAKDQATAAVPMIVQFLETFRDRLIMAENEKQLQEVSTEYQSGKIVRVLVWVLGNVGTSESKQSLQELLQFSDDQFAHFPSLKEDLQHALE